jgi:uncharacterized membrane protein YdbT with pleckstrin-like domain
MSYVESNLLPDEEILYRANIHWIVYLKSMGICLVSLLFMFSADTIYLGFIGLIVAGAFWLIAWLKVVTTELVVTSKRIIAKVGFIRRNTIELNLNKVESISVNQTIIARILNYGTVVIHGTGNSRLPVAQISKPLKFRNESNLY